MGVARPRHKRPELLRACERLDAATIFVKTKVMCCLFVREAHHLISALDDANVERFCTLLEDMVRDTGTRFMVVTHHQMTMARMDRLYGVTMQERGVSRLLSVDLQRATEMVDQPRMAAE